VEGSGSFCVCSLRIHFMRNIACRGKSQTVSVKSSTLSSLLVQSSFFPNINFDMQQNLPCMLALLMYLILLCYKCLLLSLLGVFHYTLQWVLFYSLINCFVHSTVEWKKWVRKSWSISIQCKCISQVSIVVHFFVYWSGSYDAKCVYIFVFNCTYLQF